MELKQDKGAIKTLTNFEIALPSFNNANAWGSCATPAWFARHKHTKTPHVQVPHF
jgi:hypothetical protein